MPDLLSVLPTLILGIIAVGVGLFFMLSGISQQREQRVQWYCQSRIVAGIGLMILAFGQALDAIISAPALRNRLSFSTATFGHTMGDGSIVLCCVLGAYAILLQIRSRKPGNEETTPRSEQQS